MSAPLDPLSDDATRIAALLNRPVQQRVLEFKYRFAQAVIFGLPVLVLQYFGRSLGGSPVESSRWTGLLQAILAGWVTYVAAMGMVVEGLMILPKRFTFDLPIALAAILLYVYSAISVVGVFIRGQPFYQPMLFHWSVIILASWCGTRWAWMRRTSAP
jgi:cation transport ATPase